MDGPRQNTQLALAFMDAPTGEAPKGVQQGTEPSAAKREPERPAREERLMEEVCERNNLVKAWKQVRGNKGSPGVDGKTIGDTLDALREHWPAIRDQLLQGTYRPQPVRRVNIPKPGGGVRKLGIPAVLDRGRTGGVTLPPTRFAAPIPSLGTLKMTRWSSVRAIAQAGRVPADRPLSRDDARA